MKLYRVFRAQTKWTFILPSELPTEERVTCGEKCRRRRIRLLSTWCRAAAFFSASGAALSQEVPTVK
jgi:hypothetical protein